MRLVYNTIRMNRVVQIVSHLFRPKPTVMLGRWKISNSESTLTTIVKYANEDHCGTCVNAPKEQKPIPVKHS